MPGGPGDACPPHLRRQGTARRVVLRGPGRALPDGGLPPEPPFAPHDIAGFHRALTAVRTAGYGLNTGESEPGTTALGCCARDADGRAGAAISVSVPTLRLPRSRIPEAEAAVTAAAARVTAQPAA
ncbi:IclR family transcriptional regulator domain-containing protein [Streptomyces tendae]|uniref:IclR family transcriptional regulator domain-containing protein n=1 Tax=Streptomyces tendae TaxID=1932 RepID=UPI00384F066F